jgi:hypothetical protein
MAYPEDLVGKAIRFESPRGATPRGMTLTMERATDVSVPVFTYTAPRPGVGGAPPIPAKFTNLNAPWNICVLEYISGQVTTAPLTKPVFTGPMSGCYLFSYNALISGRGSPVGPTVSHVGTDDEGPFCDKSMQAKNNWKSYLEQSKSSNVKGFSPRDVFTIGELVAGKVGPTGPIPLIFGLFDPNGKTYGVTLASIPGQNNMRMVSAVKAVNLLTWSAIAGMRTFR